MTAAVKQKSAVVIWLLAFFARRCYHQSCFREFLELYLPKCLKGGRVHITAREKGSKQSQCCIWAVRKQKLADSDRGSTAKMSNGPMNCTKERKAHQGSDEWKLQEDGCSVGSQRRWFSCRFLRCRGSGLTLFSMMTDSSRHFRVPRRHKAVQVVRKYGKTSLVSSGSHWVSEHACVFGPIVYSF